MALPLIVSILHRLQGLETLSHFVLVEGTLTAQRRCSGCGTHLWDRLLPVELSDSGEVDQEERRGEPLCRVCSYRTAKRIGAAWPSLSPDDIASLWRDVNAEQAREVERELQGYGAAALEETQRAFAASKEAAVHDGVDCALEARSYGSVDMVAKLNGTPAFVDLKTARLGEVA